MKSDKSGWQAKTIQNVAGGKFTRGKAAREFPRGLREGIWLLRRSLTRSRIPPAAQAKTSGNFQNQFWVSVLIYVTAVDRA